MTRVLFVTGSGTDIGKTYTSVSLLRGLTAQGLKPDVLKPVMSGFDAANLAASDAGLLLAAAGKEVNAESVAAIAPFRFAPALPPTIAAARENRTLYFRNVVTVCRAAIAAAPDFLLIEGAGGVMSPIAEGAKVIDLIAELEVPALLVGGSYLGAASHTLTALAVLDMRGIAVTGVVINESEHSFVALADNMGLIAPFASDRKLIAVRRGADRGDDLAALALAASAEP